MRKLLIGLLAIGLVFAFVAPSFATDASFSGAFRVRGFHLDRDSALKSDTTTTSQYYDQRFRLSTKFAIADGVGLEARGDIIDNKVWGDPAGDPTEEMNFDKAYGWFTTGIGTFTLGKNSDNTWGTAFADGEVFTEYAQWLNTYGPVTALFRVVKGVESDRATTSADLDQDLYKAAVIYGWEGGQAGLLGVYVRDAQNRGSNYTAKWWVISPYVKATFGPVDVEAEILWTLGSERDYETSTADEDYDGLSAYAQAKMNIGPANVGIMAAHVSGDDTATADNEAGYTGSDWNPSVILFNDQGDTRFGGATFGYDGATAVGGTVYQIFAGISPMEKLSLRAALSQFYVDQKGTAVDDDLGTTFDVEATYKIFDSVEYYIGFGYLWAGDYWKGSSSATEIEDSYVVMHKIQWNF